MLRYQHTLSILAGLPIVYVISMQSKNGNINFIFLDCCNTHSAHIVKSNSSLFLTLTKLIIFQEGFFNLCEHLLRGGDHTISNHNTDDKRRSEFPSHPTDSYFTLRQHIDRFLFCAFRVGKVTIHYISSLILRVPVQILVDAMGLGKTLVIIALILARPSRESSETIEITKKQIDSHRSTPRKPKGCTLVLCPGSFLSQWKVNLL